MVEVVRNLSEERSGTVWCRTQRVGVLSIRLTESHVVDGSLCIDTTIEEVGSLLILLILRVIDFLTEQEREIVQLDAHVVAGRIGPGVRLGSAIGQGSYRHLLVYGALTGRGQPTPITLRVAE